MSQKLVLIDGHSILNRAFYGVPDLSNAEGLHTNAIYGFLNIMFKILEEEKPDYLAVAFDVHAPTFRHKMYEAYKGTRKPMPEELRERFEQVSTLGGVSSNIYITYRQEMITEVGTDPQVEVTVTSNENAGSAKLTEVRSDFPDASVANQIDFQVKVTGSEGSTTMEGSTYVTQIKGQWYLTTYNLLLDKVS